MFKDCDKDIQVVVKRDHCSNLISAIEKDVQLIIE